MCYNYIVNKNRKVVKDMEQDKYAIRSDWTKHYKTLEQIRKSGITNMFGAAPYLASMNGISEELATKILCNWIHNYDALNKKYGWQ